MVSTPTPAFFRGLPWSPEQMDEMNKSHTLTREQIEEMNKHYSKKQVHNRNQIFSLEEQWKMHLRDVANQKIQDECDRQHVLLERSHMRAASLQVGRVHDRVNGRSVSFNLTTNLVNLEDILRIWFRPPVYSSACLRSGDTFTLELQCIVDSSKKRRWNDSKNLKSFLVTTNNDTELNGFSFQLWDPSISPPVRAIHWRLPTTKFVATIYSNQ